MRINNPFNEKEKFTLYCKVETRDTQEIRYVVANSGLHLWRRAVLPDLITSLQFYSSHQVPTLFQCRNQTFVDFLNFHYFT